MQDMKMMDQEARHENAGRDIAGRENTGLKMLDTKIDGIKQLTCYEVTTTKKGQLFYLLNGLMAS